MCSLNKNQYWWLTHNSQNHHTCTPHCWFHHCRSHPQPRDEFQHCKFLDDNMHTLNIFHCLESICSNHPHHSCNQHGWFRHCKNHLQSFQDRDNLNFINNCIKKNDVRKLLVRKLTLWCTKNYLLKVQSTNWVKPSVQTQWFKSMLQTPWPLQWLLSAHLNSEDM